MPSAGVRAPAAMTLSRATMNDHLITFCVVAVICVVVTGCGPAGNDLHAMLQSEDPTERARAATEAARIQDESAVGLLIERLTDIDIEVRMMSAIALEEITGIEMDYRAWDPPQHRQQVQREWREWLARGRSGPEPGHTNDDGATGRMENLQS